MNLAKNLRKYFIRKFWVRNNYVLKMEESK